MMAGAQSQLARNTHGEALALAALASKGEDMDAVIDCSTPVLILGGKENALSIVRHLGSRGITVRVSGGASCWGMQSRHCAESFPIPFGRDAADHWHNLLLAPGGKPLEGHIILACSDEALEFLAEYRDALAPHYRLDDARPDLQTALLDKQRTLELAREAGIPAPKFWQVRGEGDIADILATATLPLMVKPLHSHKFIRVFGKKLFIVEHSLDEVAEKVRLARSHDLDVMVVEMIPGPDNLLSSYYTYIDAKGSSLFHFTKRIIRRYPVNRGNACYHATEWLPETAEAGRKFFAGIGFRGLGNIEFKRDTRDGQLKIIEVNARFTAAQALLRKAGAPVDLIVYCHLTGQPVPRFESYAQDLRFWYPQRDFLAFLELRRRGELKLGEWLRSILPYRKVLPLLDPSDPLPSLSGGLAFLRQLLRGRG